jgi:hypothetical protein
MIMIYLFSAVVCGIIGYTLGQEKGRANAGLWLGVLLGPLGVIATLLLSDAQGSPRS